jgi:N-sulfoglucosamine sulfohydrolase
MKSTLLFIILLFFGVSCQNEQIEIPNQTATPPNILWLVAEDMSPYIPSFGDSTIQTPNLSRLAAEGIRYTNVYSISGVCSPSRAALATGMYPSNIGAHHMRTLYQQPAAKKMGIINYECVLPPDVKMVSEIMRQNGYYCTNNRKEDYQFFASKMAWDESSNYAHWRNRPEGKPFFSIFNFGVTHESNMWNPGYRHFDNDTFPPPRTKKNFWKGFENGNKPLSVREDLEVNIPPYLPDNEMVKKDMRRMYSNIIEMDRHVGMLLNQLEEDGLLENTIIVWYTDHGGPLPRQKRLLYDSGLHVPMIIRYPNQKRAGEIDSQLISFIDFAPNLLSQANIEPPKYTQGQAFSGKYQAKEQRKYIHAAADRFDETYDMIRAVRDKRYKYLKNFQSEKPYYLPLAYREKMATMKELLRLRDEGKLNEKQMLWFRDSKPEEELFDTENDPHELNNLADDPNYEKKLAELRIECERWMEEIKDMGFIPEEELIKQFWPNKKQPLTANPIIKNENGKIYISCETKGASIGYKLEADGDNPAIGWRIYDEPFDIPEGKNLKVISHRIGYAVSDTLVVN